MQTDQLYCRILLETSFNFSATEALSTNSPIQPQKLSCTKIIPSLPTTPSCQQHQDLLPIRKPTFVPTTQQSINTLGSTLEAPWIPAQPEDIQEILSEFDNLKRSQHIDDHSPQVATTQEVSEKVIYQLPQDLQPDINTLAALVNIYIIMTPSISATTTLPSYLSENSPLFLKYKLDISPSMLQ